MHNACPYTSEVPEKATRRMKWGDAVISRNSLVPVTLGTLALRCFARHSRIGVDNLRQSSCQLFLGTEGREEEKGFLSA
jgi:hypothetical protein